MTSSLTTRDYQAAAISSVLEHLQTEDRAQIQMACGTGKTLVCFKVAQQLVPQASGKNLLMLFPNLNLIAQTIRAWNSYGVSNILRFCSDASDVEGVSIPHTTDAAELLRLMEIEKGRRVVFSTYQSAENLVNAGLPEWDLIVFDEAHRAAGAADSVFATAVDNVKIPAKKRFFATATPRISVTSLNKGAEGDAEAGFDMDDTERFGQRVFSYSHKEAVEAGWINDFKLALVAVTNEEMAEAMIEQGSEAPLTQVAAAVALSKATRQHHLRSTLTYHRTISRADEFSLLLQDIDRQVRSGVAPKLETFSVSSRDAAQAEQVLERVRTSTDDERIVVSNCKLLGEGVDVPGLDSLSFVDPKGSVIDVTQAIGRIVRVNNGDKREGLVLLPVIVKDLEASIGQVEDAIDRANFSMLYATLNALQALDPRISDELMMAAQAHAMRRAVKDQPEADGFDLEDDDHAYGHGEGSRESIDGEFTSFETEIAARIIGLGRDFRREEIIDSVHVMFAARRSANDPERHKEEMFRVLVEDRGMELADAMDTATIIFDELVQARSKGRHQLAQAA